MLQDTAFRTRLERICDEPRLRNCGYPDERPGASPPEPRLRNLASEPCLRTSLASGRCRAAQPRATWVALSPHVSELNNSLCSNTTRAHACTHTHATCTSASVRSPQVRATSTQLCEPQPLPHTHTTLLPQRPHSLSHRPHPAHNTPALVNPAPRLHLGRRISPGTTTPAPAPAAPPRRIPATGLAPPRAHATEAE